MSKSTRSFIEPKTFGQWIKGEFDKFLTKILDSRPLPLKFPRNLLVELYVARTLLFASFTIGVRVGALPIVYIFFREIFGYFIVNSITYLALPLIGLNVALLSVKKKINTDEARAVGIIWAFLCGIFSSISNIHYQLSEHGAPTYFMPVIVGLTVYALSGRLDHDRKLLVGVSVGSATSISLILLLITGEFSSSIIFPLTLCTINAIIGLQTMIYDLIEDGANIDGALTHTVGVIFVMVNMLIVSRVTGKYAENPSSNNVAASTPFHSVFSG